MNANTSQGNRAPAREFDECADFLKVVAEKTRLELLCRIAVRPACVKELVALTGLESSGLSKHLRPMRLAGIVEYEHDGQRHVFRLGPAVSNVVHVPGGPRATLRDPTGRVHVISLPPVNDPGFVVELKPPGRAPAVREDRPIA